MARYALDDIEELARCSYCRRAFDDDERAPKLLECKHHFCLECARGALGGASGVRCAHCWQRTAPPDGRAAALPTHAAVLALAMRLAGGARPHGALCRDARALAADLRRLAARRRDLLLRALDAATALKLRLEAELSAPASPDDCASSEAEAGLLPSAAAAAERERLRARHVEALLQGRLDDLVRDSSVPLDFDSVGRALTTPAGELRPAPAAERRDPVLLLANYCTAQLYVRYCAARRARVWADAPEPDAREAPSLSPDAWGGPGPCNVSAGSPILRNPSAPFPLFYLELEMDGEALGRVVVEVREDAAPRMARNFAALVTGELGVGYRGCVVFQCWENESVITGDFELNNGRGGRSVFEESFFMPDDTRMSAVRGAVGMRRSQKRHNNLGLVGSQFRIILREMRGFSAIFGSVVEGLELVELVSRAGDGAGKPHSSVVIARCGRLH